MSQRAAAWNDLLHAQNILPLLAICGGVLLHALNIFIAVPVLPIAVKEIGGLDYFALNSSAFVGASIIGSAVVAKVIESSSSRQAYLTAGFLFALGSVISATALNMPMMILGNIIKGLGGGFLIALSYIQLNDSIEQKLWPMAMSLMSLMWGIATLCGPAIGGALSTAELWRYAYWLSVPLTLLVLLAAVLAFPQNRNTKSETVKVAGRQLVILTLAIMLYSGCSLTKNAFISFALFTTGTALLVLLANVERRSYIRLLPSNTFNSGYGLFIAMAALLSIIAIWSNVFVSYFLQVIHLQSPLVAGYISALIAGGWTTASIATAGYIGRKASLAVFMTSVWVLIAAILLAFVMPGTDKPDIIYVILVAIGMFMVGAGIGSGWPHLSTWIMTEAPEKEAKLASGSIVLVQNASMAVAAAIAGLVANNTGLISPGGVQGTSSAAFWLYTLMCIPALLSMWVGFHLLQKTGSR